MFFFGFVTKNWAGYVAVKNNTLNFSYQIIRSFYDKSIARPSTGNSHLKGGVGQTFHLIV